LAGAALLVLSAAGIELALPAMPGWLIHVDPPARCDLIVVEGSNPEGSTEMEAARLWRRGQAEKVLCVGRPKAWQSPRRR
jgi:hypothetical protein